MGSALAAAACLGLAAWSATAAAQGGEFPTATDLSTVRAWLQANGLPPERLALATAASAFSLETPAPPGAALVRQELLDPMAADLLAGRSVRILLECSGTLPRPLKIEVFARHGLRGASHPVSESVWRAADPDAGLEDLVPIACRGISQPRPAQASAKWVQIGAFGSRELAAAAFAALERRLPEDTRGLELRTEPARAKLRRALVGPFRGVEEARTFCARLAAAQTPCFVR